MNKAITATGLNEEQSIPQPSIFDEQLSLGNWDKLARRAAPTVGFRDEQSCHYSRGKLVGQVAHTQPDLRLFKATPTAGFN